MCKTTPTLSHTAHRQCFKACIDISFVLKRLDTKQSPYRLLYRRANGSCLQVAVAETEKQADTAWSWIDGTHIGIVLVG